MTPTAAVCLMFLVAGFGLFAWVTRPGERMIYRVSCPVHGVEATIAVRPPRGDEPRHVVRCSLREPPDRIDCAERCLRTATSTA